jgi:recombination protein U
MASSHANRGSGLELHVELANRQYIALGIAEIQKIAVPTHVKQNHHDNSVEIAREKSTVDFVGAWAGRPVAFDAKETQDPAGFPLGNIKPHQYDFLKLWRQVGGQAFVLILFVPDQAVYILPFDRLNEYWMAWRAGARASIPADQLRQLPKVRAGRGCALDYLATLSAWLKSGA